KRLLVCLSEKYPSDNLIPFLQVQQLCYDVTTFPTDQDVLHDNQRHQPDANQLLHIYCRDFLQFQWQVESFLRSEEHTSELQSRFALVCRLLLEKKSLVIESSSSYAHFIISVFI